MFSPEEFYRCDEPQSDDENEEGFCPEVTGQADFLDAF